MTNDAQAQSTRHLGAVGENMATVYLQQHGYEILGRNLNCRYGEIDVVAQKGDSLYFVEIKRRLGHSHGSALMAVSPTKIKRIKKSAHHFLFRNPEWQKLIPYFSVLAIDEDPSGVRAPQLEFLPNAFM